MGRRDQIEKMADAEAEQLAQPVLRSMYPMMSRGDMKNVFRRIIIAAAEWADRNPDSLQHPETRRGFVTAVERVAVLEECLDICMKTMELLKESRRPALLIQATIEQIERIKKR